MWIDRDGNRIELLPSGRRPRRTSAERAVVRVTRAELVELFAPIRRFTPSRKAALVNVVKKGHARLGDVLAAYRLPLDEWLAWAAAAERGELALRVTSPRYQRRSAWVG